VVRPGASGIRTFGVESLKASESGAEIDTSGDGSADESAGTHPDVNIRGMIRKTLYNRKYLRQAISITSKPLFLLGL
jgi:hypothetical protein